MGCPGASCGGLSERLDLSQAMHELIVLTWCCFLSPCGDQPQEMVTNRKKKDPLEAYLAGESFKGIFVEGREK